MDSKFPTTHLGAAVSSLVVATAPAAVSAAVTTVASAAAASSLKKHQPEREKQIWREPREPQRTSRLTVWATS